MSPDGDCEGGNARMVLYEAESARPPPRAVNCARYGRCARTRHPHPRRARRVRRWRPRVAGRGFISRLWGFEMTTPRPHVFMRKHCHSALPHVQYDVPLGGPAVIQGLVLCFRIVLRFI